MLPEETDRPFRRRANVPVASNISREPSACPQRMWIYGGSIIGREKEKRKEKEKERR